MAVNNTPKGRDRRRNGADANDADSLQTCAAKAVRCVCGAGRNGGTGCRLQKSIAADGHHFIFPEVWFFGDRAVEQIFRYRFAPSLPEFPQAAEYF